MRSEPAWWAEARRLYAEGETQAEIAARFGKHPSAVAMATDPERRKRVAEDAKAWRTRRVNYHTRKWGSA